jgi:hypothetical protein
MASIKQIGSRALLLFNKRRWLIFYILTFVLLFIFVVPKPWKRYDLNPINHDSPIQINQNPITIKIPDYLAGVFSTPLLYEKYDITFANTPSSSTVGVCSRNISVYIYKLNNETVISDATSSQVYNGNNNITYYLEEGAKIIIKAYSKNNNLSYHVSGITSAETDSQMSAYQIGKIENCMHDFNFVSISAKSNFNDWLGSTLELGIILILFYSALRGILAPSE